MKTTSALVACQAISLAQASKDSNAVNPIQKVVELMTALQAKVIGEGEESQKVYEEFAEWCEDSAKQVKYEIKSAKEQVVELKAVIDKSSADEDALNSKIEDLTSAISSDEKDLKAASEVRAREKTDFEAEDKELLQDVDTVQRAISIIEKENGAALVQMKSASTVTEALSAMVQASSLQSADASRLTALLQSDDSDDDDDDDTGAPAASVHESQSGAVVDTLEDLEEKAQTQLEAARKQEAESLNAFELLKQSLDDKIKFASRELDASKKALASAKEKKASAQGDVDVTQKDLDEDVVSLGDLHHDCMGKASEFEEEVKSRAEELKAIATAKKIVVESTGGANEQSYSLLQLDRSTDSQTFKAARFVRKLARQEHSTALNQLSQRMASAAKFSSDPFAKVKGLIADMLEKLQTEAEEDATKEAYCDKEIAESEKKKGDKSDSINVLTARIEKASADSAILKQEVAILERELAQLAKTQAEADKLRMEEKALFNKNKPEYEQGIKGIQSALKVISEYYAKDDKSHDDASGAGGSIIGLLEVIEADFSKGLSELVSAEDASQNEYDTLKKDNGIDMMTKTQDVKYKTREHKGLDKEIAEANSDKDGVSDELAAVTQYLEKLKGECVTKPASYEERKKRRENEIAGLKDALDILESEASESLIQRGSKHHVLRGSTSRVIAA